MKLLFKLRYNLEIKWLDQLDYDWPVLLLPNHPSLLDSILIELLGSKHKKLAPVVYEWNYNKPVVRKLIDLYDPIIVPDIIKEEKTKNISKINNQIINKLKNNEWILLFPSGWIHTQWYTKLRRKKLTYEIMQEIPENTKIIGLRIRWLWWSMFSKAWKGTTPNPLIQFLKAFLIIIANFIFFVPKRNVSVQLEDITKELKQKSNSNLEEFNKYLESFYNQQGTEKLRYIKHFFYYNNVKNKKLPEVIEYSDDFFQRSKTINHSVLGDNEKNQIINKIKEIKEFDNKVEISPTQSLVSDLYFDSLDLSEIKTFIKNNFPNCSNPPILELKIVQDLFEMAAGKSPNETTPPYCNLKTSKQGKKLLENFERNYHSNLPGFIVNSLKENKNQPFIRDQKFWQLTKKDYLTKAYVLSCYLQKIKWKYIWIMLPATTSASVVLTAFYLAGKIPVMMNRTLDKNWFDHCFNFSNINYILTSKEFYENIKNNFLEEYKKNWYFIFMEDVAGNLQITDKIKWITKYLISYIPKQDSQAVILFTSWSETLPKAVPLTHKNIIENIRWSIKIFNIKDCNILLGFLPPFHSFWFTVNTLLPLLTWLKMAYTPNPYDWETIKNIIRHCGITALTSTPTFFKIILNHSGEADLQSLRYVILGGEKVWNEIYNNFRNYNKEATVIEWYGITECSPVITIDPMENPKLGSAWIPLPGLDLKIISSETMEPLWTNQEWIICVKWESIFRWYPDKDIPSPFVTINNETYYNTKDMGYIDNEWYLYITWRLKRFVKIAGEMISLPYIEGILTEWFQQTDSPEIAVKWEETEDEVKICVFTTLDLSKEQLNNYLWKQQVSNIIRIDKVIKINEMPILGTWKIDYKNLSTKQE